MGQKILILNILKNLRKQLKVILSITFLSIGVVWFLLYFVLVPEYKATSQILVEQEESSVPSAVADSQLASQVPGINETYSATIRSPQVLGEVIKELGLKVSVKQLHERIIVSEAADSQVLNITVSSADKELAIQIANSVAVNFKKKIPEMMQVEKVSVIPITSDQLPTSPFEENMVFSLGVAGAFGFIIGTLVAFILEMLNTLFKTGRQDSKTTAAKLQTVFK
ncbi:Wzz/FepE/Etk N-terminal domain-containing protein [Planococcus shenhongbingii]|uniref:YveK family protein n=1 Tax=Planococcus shenhongbingii TaxID=3058398 RepID=UPI00260631E0|nr:Wzz/FepE/Etk N-terminal domain-containing protein [Planococcus sp. N016]WKA57627.1 Wzz/FepE/Etk N-terminal domain-containing protein [Planococcus sp. N016]